MGAELDESPGLCIQTPNTYSTSRPGPPAQHPVGSEPPLSCLIGTRVGLRASSSPPPSWARGPLGIRPGAHAAQPAPETDGAVRGAQSCSSDSDAGVGRGPHTIREPTSSPAFLLAAELVALIKEQLARPPPSAAPFLPATASV